MADSILNIAVDTHKRVDVVRATGRIDSSSASGFDEALKNITGEGRYNIVIELSGVDYMSSAGLRAMVATLKECRKHRGDVRLAPVSDRVSEVLSLAGLDSLFEKYGSTTAAVGSF